MLVCDRCGKHAQYHDYYVAGRKHDLCSTCERDLSDIQKEFFNLEKEFMRNEFDVIKHIDCAKKRR